MPVQMAGNTYQPPREPQEMNWGERREREEEKKAVERRGEKKENGEIGRKNEKKEK